MHRLDTVHLFPEISRRLLVLLESLTTPQWDSPVSNTWTVRSVATHLLDSSLRRLSAQRDGFTAPGAPENADYATLLAYLNGLNADWVQATARLSPRVITGLIRWSDEQLADLFAGLDPDGAAIWPVAWAGEAESPNWLDIAREYTEKWHHTQQIFEATARPSTICTREFMRPCLEALMLGVPHGLRKCERPEGTTVCIRVTGDAGDDWFFVFRGSAWRLSRRRWRNPAAKITMAQDDAWKVLMKRLTAEQARALFPSMRESGDQELTSAVLETVCVMA